MTMVCKNLFFYKKFKNLNLKISKTPLLIFLKKKYVLKTLIDYLYTKFHNGMTMGSNRKKIICIVMYMKFAIVPMLKAHYL